jgi:hypothetical protein
MSAAAASSTMTRRRGWSRSSDAGTSAVIGPSSVAPRIAALSSPVASSQISRAAAIPAIPSVTPCVGGGSMP